MADPLCRNRKRAICDKRGVFLECGKKSSAVTLARARLIRQELWTKYRMKLARGGGNEDDFVPELLV